MMNKDEYRYNTHTRPTRHEFRFVAEVEMLRVESNIFTSLDVEERVGSVTVLASMERLSIAVTSGVL